MPTKSVPTARSNDEYSGINDQWWTLGKRRMIPDWLTWHYCFWGFVSLLGVFGVAAIYQYISHPKILWFALAALIGAEICFTKIAVDLRSGNAKTPEPDSPSHATPSPTPPPARDAPNHPQPPFMAPSSHPATQPTTSITEKIFSAVSLNWIFGDADIGTVQLYFFPSSLKENVIYLIPRAIFIRFTNLSAKAIAIETFRFVIGDGKNPQKVPRVPVEQGRVYMVNCADGLPDFRCAKPIEIEDANFRSAISEKIAPSETVEGWAYLTSFSFTDTLRLYIKCSDGREAMEPVRNPDAAQDEHALVPNEPNIHLGAIDITGYTKRLFDAVPDASPASTWPILTLSTNQVAPPAHATSSASFTARASERDVHKARLEEILRVAGRLLKHISCWRLALNETDLQPSDAAGMELNNNAWKKIMIHGRSAEKCARDLAIASQAHWGDAVKEHVVVLNSAAKQDGFRRENVKIIEQSTRLLEIRAEADLKNL
jgi:hypothetical protein